jgi:hypothetical protein
LGALIVLIALLMLRYLVLPAVGVHFSTEQTGVAWIARTSSHVFLVVVLSTVLLLQYFKRETSMARAVLIGGLTLFLCIHAMPWRTAYAIQQAYSSSGGSSVMLSLEPQAAAASALPGRLLTTESEAAPEHGVIVSLPVRMSGLAAGVLAHSDRVGVRFEDERGRTLYQGSGRAFELRGTGSDQVFLQRIELPQRRCDPARAE